MSLGNRDGQILDEWQLKTGEAVKSVKELTKAIRAEERHEKSLALIRSKLDAKTNALKATTDAYKLKTAQLTAESNKLAAATERLRARNRQNTKELRAATVVGNLYAVAIQKGLSALRGAAEGTAQYTQAQHLFTGELKGARAATQGYASDLDIMSQSNKMAALGVKMADEEFNNFLGDITIMANAMGRDLADAMDSATTALSRQSSLRADDVGVIMSVGKANDEWARANNRVVSSMTEQEKRIAFQKSFLRKLAENAKKTGKAIDTVSTAYTKTSVAFVNAFHWAFSSVDRRMGLSLERFAAYHRKVYYFLRYGHKGLDALKEEGRTRWENRSKESRLKIDQDARDQGFYANPGGALGGGAGMMPGGDEGGGAQGIYSSQHARDVLRYRNRNDKGEYVGGRRGAVGGGGRGGGRAKSNAYTPMSREFSGADIERIQNLQREKDILPILTQMRREALAAQADADAQSKAGSAILDERIKGYEATLQWTDRVEAGIKQLNQGFFDVAMGGLQTFVDGMWAAADAAIVGGDSFGMAMAKMTKATLMSISQQAGVKALFYTAEAFGLAAPTMGVPNSGSISAGTAAIIFGSIAAGTGAAALGISAGIKSAGGYGNKSGDNADKAAADARKASQRRQSFGTAKNINPVFNINLYMKPSRNSAMGYIGDQRITTRLGLGEMLQAA
jgi:hypothetical protein